MAIKIKGWIGTISLGVVFIGGLIWLYSQSVTLFPENPLLWQTRVGVYILMLLAVFSWDILGKKTERRIFSITFFKAFPKLVFSFIISFAILFLIGRFVLGNEIGLIASLSKIALPVLVFHLVVVSITEEMIFRGAVPEVLQRAKASRTAIYLVSSIVFALFHYATSNGELLMMFMYVPLGLIFMAVRDRWSPRTQMANSGTHCAWNMAIVTGLMGA